MGLETTVRGILERHGFSESSSKPGLFYVKNETARYFLDMRTPKTKLYGFDMNNNQIEQSTIDIILRKVKRDLAAAGCGRIEDYNADNERGLAEPVEQRIPVCKLCGNTLTVLCHSCGSRVCSSCGGKVVR